MFLPLRSNMDKYILFIQFKRKKLPGKCKENNVQPILQLAFIIIIFKNNTRNLMTCSIFLSSIHQFIVITVAEDSEGNKI